jgi:SAM-dependent methyltransferase
MSCKALLKKLFNTAANEKDRAKWISKTLAEMPAGARILDAGAGELRWKPHCSHLNYVSQDFCQYEGAGNGQGLQTGTWDTSRIDIVCDLTSIPEPDGSFDVILCSEVFEHLPDPLAALDEFARLLTPGGQLVLTAPFASAVHFAPYHFYSGFSRYWYEHHLALRRFDLVELSPNGDWFSFYRQEMVRLGRASREYGDWCWPLSYLYGFLGILLFSLRGGGRRKAADLACFGWHCLAKKRLGGWV